MARIREPPVRKAPALLRAASRQTGQLAFPDSGCKQQLEASLPPAAQTSPQAMPSSSRDSASLRLETEQRAAQVLSGGVLGLTPTVTLNHTEGFLKAQLSRAKPGLSSSPGSPRCHDAEFPLHPPHRLLPSQIEERGEQTNQQVLEMQLSGLADGPVSDGAELRSSQYPQTPLPAPLLLARPGCIPAAASGHSRADCQIQPGCASNRLLSQPCFMQWSGLSGL
nr:PREDICTED: uncharacterized protein LOC104151791 [Struthio camelus australis]